MRTVLNKMASTVVNFYLNFYRPSASEHSQNITNITMIWKTKLCCFIDMYIGKIFWPMAPCQGCPEKEIINKLGTRLGCFRVRFLTPFCLNPSTVFWIQMSRHLHQVTATGDKASFAVVCAAFRCLFYRLA